MKIENFLRYLLVSSMIIPGIIFALLPVLEYLKIKINSWRRVFFIGILILILIFGSAFLASLYLLRVRKIFISFSILFFAVYFAVVNLSFTKKLFCFFNSLVLCAWCNFFTIIFMAPIDIQDIIIWYKARLFSMKAAVVCLSLSVITGAFFYRTLTKKIPTLLHEERLGNAWNYLFLIPLVMAAMFFWMAPINPSLMVIGRIRPISMVLITFVLFAVFIFYEIFWRITTSLTESAKLQQENNLYLMESKRYNELKDYMNETRVMRHDFRQHIAVLTELARAKKINEILNYAEELNEKSRSYVPYCANNAVDAIASYYDNKAGENKIKINWRLELPEELPIKESEFCAMLGNLIENALNALKKFSPEENKEKIINVIASMLSEVMLGISIDNPFDGELKFNRDSLPTSKLKNHGLGLISVFNLVKRYNGSLRIKTGNKIFKVDIILFCNA